MDSVIHKDEITPILEQIKALNYVCDYEQNLQWQRTIRKSTY